MSDKLEACPYCGGEAEYVGQEGMGYWVQCASCDARGPWGDYGYQALAAWNRRTPTPEQAGEVDEIVGHWHYLAGQPSGVFMPDPVDEASLKHGWRSYPLYRKPYPHVASTPPAQPTAGEVSDATKRMERTLGVPFTRHASVAKPTAEVLPSAPKNPAADAVEKIAVELSDKVIQRLDIHEDDPRLPGIIDELRASLTTMAGDYVMVLAKAAADLNTATDGMEELRPQREAVLSALKLVAASPTGCE